MGMGSAGIMGVATDEYDCLIDPLIGELFRGMADRESLRVVLRQELAHMGESYSAARAEAESADDALDPIVERISRWWASVPARPSPLIIGELYDGADGPTIMLVMVTLAAGVWLQEVFRDLARLKNPRTLTRSPEVRVVNVAAIEMVCVADGPRIALRSRDIGGDHSFVWSATVEGWLVPGRPRSAALRRSCRSSVPNRASGTMPR